MQRRWDVWLLTVLYGCCYLGSPRLGVAQQVTSSSGDGSTVTFPAENGTADSTTASSFSSPQSTLMNITRPTASVSSGSSTASSASVPVSTQSPLPPSLLLSLAARIATRSCVRFGSNPGDFSSQFFSAQVSAFCPTYARRYADAEGVSLFAINGLPNATGLARLISTSRYYQQTFGEQLDYYTGSARSQLLHGLAEVQWDGSTAADMEKRVDLLTCTSLYPPCVNIDGELLSLPACDWFCEDLRRALLPLAEALVTDRSALVSSGYYALLYSTSHSCIQDGAVTSNSTAARGTAASASPPRCQNCTKTACSETKVTVMVPGATESRAPPGRLCFNTSTLRPCPAPFISTPVVSHWDGTVQDNFLGVVSVTRGMLRVNSSFLIANGSFLPCTFDCRDALFFTQSERDAVVLTLGIISLFVFIFGLFALGSFALNWRRLKQYPQRLVLIVNINVFISIFGICGQFLTSNSDSYLCNDDESVRRDVPDGTSDGAACTILFIILYFFSMASVAWWVCLSHAWYVTLPCIKQPDFGRRRNQAYEKWYHLCTWPPVAILTVVQLATQDVGGVHFYGICWMDNDLARFGYLVVPLCVASIFGSVFLFLGIRSFSNSRSAWRSMTINASPDGKKTKKKGPNKRVEQMMRSLLVRLCILLIAVLIHMIVQIIVGSIRRAKWDEWTQLTRTRLSCLLTTCNDSASCPPLPEVSVVLLAIPPAASGTYALSTYIWAFNLDNFKLWRNFFLRLLHRLGIISDSKGAYEISQLSSSTEALPNSSMHKLTERHNTCNSLVLSNSETS